MGLRETLPVFALVGGGGGAGLGFCIFTRSLLEENSVCLFLRALHSSPAAPIGGNTLGFRSSACRALVLELSGPDALGLFPTLGVKALGLEPGLRSLSLPKKVEEISGDVFRRGGGVRVPIRGAFSPFCCFRGRAGLPPTVPVSKRRWLRSRGSVTDLHSVPSELVGIGQKNLELEKVSSSLGGVVAPFPPGQVTTRGNFFLGQKGTG